MKEETKIFETIIDTIENDDIKLFAERCIDTIIPPYFWKVPASSTGKYHPEYSLGDGGLARHTVGLVRLLNHILNIDCYKNDYTSRERDLMRVAGMLHDTQKSGTQEDYEKNKFTKFNHPLLAANMVRIMTGIIPDEEVEFIANCIESHMGQWNTDKRSSEVLPTPKNKYQKLVHLADYLASRKDLILLFDEEFTRKEGNYDINTYILPFGKYSGKTLIDINNIDPGYILWAKKNMEKEPIKSLLKQI